MLTETAAVTLRGQLEPLLPDFQIAAVAWSDDSPEWIVTVFEGDAVLLDIFQVAPGTLALREPGKGALIGRSEGLTGIPELVQSQARR